MKWCMVKFYANSESTHRKHLMHFFLTYMLSENYKIITACGLFFDMCHIRTGCLFYALLLYV